MIKKKTKQELENELVLLQTQLAAVKASENSINKTLRPILEIEQLQKAKSNFAEFFKQAWTYMEPGVPYQHNWHIDLMAEALTALYKGDIENLILEIPPRCAKSSITCVAFPAWIWLHNPAEKFITSSFTEKLATRDCVRARRLMQTDWYQSLEPTFEFSPDVNQKTYYENLHGGYRLTTSVGGSVIGFGYSLAIHDDPIDAKKSYQKAYIDQVLEWWTQAMSTRGNPGSRQVLMHQRLAENDPIGYELKNNAENWEVICLPLEYDPNHPQIKYWDLNELSLRDIRTVPGQNLWPYIYTPSILAQRKKKLGPFGIAAQLQQNPTPRGGGIIKKDWLKFYSRLYNTYTAYQYDLLVGSCDLTFSDAGSSYTVGQVWGRKENNYYLIDMYRDKLDVVGQIKMIRQMKKDYPKLRSILVEKMANGDAVVTQLKKEIQGLIPIKLSEIGGGDKEVRLSLASIYFEAGNIYFPHPNLCPWVIDVIEELTTFPRGEYDDICDTTSMFINWITQKLGTKTFALGTTAEELKNKMLEEASFSNGPTTYRKIKSGNDFNFITTNSLSINQSRDIFK